MKFFKVRKARKELKEVLHYARHTRHMHEDIADPKALEALRTGEEIARTARKSAAFAKGSGAPQGDRVELMEKAGEAVMKACEKVAPPKKHPKIRENVEVLFVAIAAAMAIRAYFFQPFKIPTGSMQPTLYGITVRHMEPGESTAVPNRMVKFISKGEMYLQCDSPIERIVKRLFIGPGYNTIYAKADGMIPGEITTDGIRLNYRDNFDSGQSITIFIGGMPHIVPKSMVPYLRYGEHIGAGESIVKGVVKSGDYILVNRIKYNFIRPKRGDIAVFDTSKLTHPQVRKDAYYIKRMVGLPGETISLSPPYLLVNGEKPTDQRFDKIFNNEKYLGYIFAPQSHISKPGDSITLGENEYLFFGDNTENSLDGRYFGPVDRRQILGPAFFVCLPLDRAGFAEISH